VTCSASPRPMRVIVVDDMADNAELLALTLREFGHSVRTADNGEDALAMMEESLPDVVFLDLDMPQMSGFDIADRIHELYGAQVRLIALTGSIGRKHRDHAEQCGFDAFVAKPADRARIDAALHGEVPEPHDGGGVSIRNTVRCADGRFPNSAAKRRSDA